MDKKSESTVVKSEGLPEGWEKITSSTHEGLSYFYHQPLGISQWQRPSSQSSVSGGDEHSVTGIKREREESSTGTAAAKIAVIVPFRDLDTAQHRQQHLNIFIPSLSKFLDATKQAYCIYIIEQSDDKRKFNRGKLLNIGFEYAVKDGCDVFVFHDVDLIPSVELTPWYAHVPEQPAHLARVWNRYSLNPSYFGGVVSFSQAQFQKINGFPNTFWGWGGEDDEMMLRVQACGYKPIHPHEGAGSYLDLEESTLVQKLQFLKNNATLKCMNKVEVLAEHAHTWTKNGLSTLTYKEVRRVRAAGSTKITVDIGLNEHWTDIVCSNDEKQRSIQPDQAKLDWHKTHQE